MRSLVCPYCFNRYPVADLAFRCVNPDSTRCALEPDERLSQYQRLPTSPMLQHVFVPGKRRRRSARTATCRCGMKTTKQVCPFCHNELPHELGLTKNCTVALVGAKEVGKSNYIAVLIHELKNRLGSLFNASFNALDEQTRTRYRQDFERHIYERREVIPGTVSARARIDVRYPLIYRLCLESRWFFFTRMKVITLVFFDAAGEDLDHIDLMATEANYIAQSEGIIFLLDPLQIPEVRSRVSPSVPLPTNNTQPAEIIERVNGLIRQVHGMSPTKKIDTPVALAFSKIDSIRPLVEPASPIHRAAKHNGYFDIADAEAMDESMRSYVEEWIGGGLNTTIQHNFKKHAYFGLSSLGTCPDPSGRLPAGAVPFRVEDPLLWILSQHNIIKTRRVRR